MFAVIVFFIYFYTSCAILFIVIGTGFILQQGWAARLSEGVLFLWGILGVIVLSNIVLMFTNLFNDYSAFKDRTGVNEVIIVVVMIIIVFMIVPGICLFILRSRTIRRTINRTGFLNSFFERYPLSIVLLLLMYIFLIVSYSFSFFLKSFFPVMGVFFMNLPGTIGILVCMAAVMAVAFFTIRIKPWIWWASIVLFSCMALSTIYTFYVYTFFEVCSLIGFPDKEMKILEGIFVLKNFRLSVFFGSPYILIVVLLVISRKHF